MKRRNFLGGVMAAISAAWSTRVSSTRAVADEADAVQSGSGAKLAMHVGCQNGPTTPHSSTISNGTASTTFVVIRPTQARRALVDRRPEAYQGLVRGSMASHSTWWRCRFSVPATSTVNDAARS